MENERVLRRFLLKDGVHVLFADDIWISALVLQHNIALHDRDRHFDRLPQIVRV